jgi:hypothetical protein
MSEMRWVTISSSLLNESAEIQLGCKTGSRRFSSVSPPARTSPHTLVKDVAAANDKIFSPALKQQIFKLECSIALPE